MTAEEVVDRLFAVMEDGRRRAKPPSRRGRRGHFAIDSVPGVAEWMDQQFSETPRPSFEEIERRLRESPHWSALQEAGWNTSKSSIHRYYLKWKEHGAKARAATAFAKAVEQSTSAGDMLAVEGAITSIANDMIRQGLEIEQAKGEGVTKDALALIELHQKLQASSARREAERRASGRLYAKAYEQVTYELIALVRNNPPLLAQVQAEITKWEEEQDRKQRANRERELKKASGSVLNKVPIKRRAS